MAIIIRLNGGLCNQLFQYAFARAQAVRLKTEFLLDITPFSTYYKADPYGLSKFTIKENIAKDSDMYGFVWLRKHNKFFSFIYHRLRFKKILYPWYYVEKTFKFNPEVSSSHAIYFEGFWQSEKYFKVIATDLRKEIKLKAPFSQNSQDIRKKIETVSAVSLHIRRYLPGFATWWHGSCPPEYYEEAVQYIASKVSSPHLFIFSDNYPWVIENFLPFIKSKGYSFTLVNNDNDKNAEDVFLMSYCKHHIIANSSFSWWGAWLNPDPEKIVIAPKKWFGNAPKNDTTDLIPDNWIKL